MRPSDERCGPGLPPATYRVKRDREPAAPARRYDLFDVDDDGTRDAFVTSDDYCDESSNCVFAVYRMSAGCGSFAGTIAMSPWQVRLWPAKQGGVHDLEAKEHLPGGHQIHVRYRWNGSSYSAGEAQVCSSDRWKRYFRCSAEATIRGPRPPAGWALRQQPSYLSTCESCQEGGGLPTAATNSSEAPAPGTTVPPAGSVPQPSCETPRPPPDAFEIDATQRTEARSHRLFDLNLDGAMEVFVTSDAHCGVGSNCLFAIYLMHGACGRFVGVIHGNETQLLASPVSSLGLLDLESIELFMGARRHVVYRYDGVSYVGVEQQLWLPDAVGSGSMTALPPRSLPEEPLPPRGWPGFGAEVRYAPKCFPCPGRERDLD